MPRLKITREDFLDGMRKGRNVKVSITKWMMAREAADICGLTIEGFVDRCLEVGLAQVRDELKTYHGLADAELESIARRMENEDKLEEDQ